VLRHRWGGFTCIAIAAACISSPAAAADDAPKRPLAEAFAVEPDECLEAGSLVPAVARWLGHEEIDRRISIAVRRDEGAVVYGLHRDGVLVGQRKVTNLPSGCTELRTALALSIAVAVEATFFGAEEEPATTPDAVPLPVPSPPPSPARSPVSRSRSPARPSPGPTRRSARRTGHQATLRGEAGVLWTALPGARPLFSAGIDIRWSRYLETRTAIVAATAATSPLGSGEVETRLYAGRADACAASPAWRIELRACLGLGWGLVETRGLGFLDGRTPSRPWLAMPLRGEVRIPVAGNGASLSWGLLFATDLVVTLRRAQIGVVGLGGDAQARAVPRTAVLTVPVLGGAAAVGLYFEL